VIIYLKNLLIPLTIIVISAAIFLADRLLLPSIRHLINFPFWGVLIYVTILFVIEFRKISFRNALLFIVSYCILIILSFSDLVLLISFKSNLMAIICISLYSVGIVLSAGLTDISRYLRVSYFMLWAIIGFYMAFNSCHYGIGYFPNGSYRV
jgi:hypothetical protein